MPPTNAIEVGRYHQLLPVPPAYYQLITGKRRVGGAMALHFSQNNARAHKYQTNTINIA